MVYLLHVYYFTVLLIVVLDAIAWRYSEILSKIRCKTPAPQCGLKKTFFIEYLCTDAFVFCSSLLVCFVFYKVFVQAQLSRNANISFINKLDKQAENKTCLSDHLFYNNCAF